jgi:hypothetical protein
MGVAGKSNCGAQGAKSRDDTRRQHHDLVMKSVIWIARADLHPNLRVR